MLLPERCYITIISQKFKNSIDLRTEPYYNAQFKLEKIPDEKLHEWAAAEPKEGEILDLCPPNIFVPK